MAEKNKLGLTGKILIAMGIGLLVGIFLRQIPETSGFYDFFVNGFLTVGGKIFVKTLKMLVVPLVFVSLVCGTSSLVDIRQLGRVGGKTLGLYMFTTALAISLALTIAMVIQPGVGFNQLSDAAFNAKVAPPLSQTFINIFPDNPFSAMVNGNMLQVIVFSILVGLAIALSGTTGQRVNKFFNDLNEIVLKMVTMLMEVAPYGVFCLISKVFATQGFDAFVPLLKYFFVVIAVLILHVILVYGSLLKILARLSFVRFIKSFKEAPLMAFSTASSNATLPVTLEATEHNLGVKNSIASFTVPLGATINMDGTAIMQGVATVFIAQAYNISIGIDGFLMVVLTATLASVGTAGVPGVGLITLSMVLTQVGLPVEGIALVMGVDRILDMLRTAVNVTGDGIVTCIVAKSEGQLDVDTFNKELEIGKA